MTLETPATELYTAEIDDIQRVLPHRYPFLMVDRIVNIDRSESAVGIKNVTFNEPHMQGHFPGHPIMPGVLIIEGMAQTSGAIYKLNSLRVGANKNDQEQNDELVYLLTVDNARFRSKVTPGDVLEYHVRKIRQRGRASAVYSCTAKVGERVSAEAQILAMLIPRNA